MQAMFTLATHFLPGHVWNVVIIFSHKDLIVWITISLQDATVCRKVVAFSGASKTQQYVRI